jgi:hypothetical protein
MAEQNEDAAKVLAVYRQLREGAPDVDANRLFDTAERIVHAEAERAMYQETMKSSPLSAREPA